MLKRVAVIIAAALAFVSSASARQTSPPEQKPTPASAVQAANEKTPPPARRDPPQQVNVRIELTITDQTGPGEPSKKVVTMLVADGHHTSIRTSGWVLTPAGRRDVGINVDANPVILKEPAIRLELGIQYQPTGTGGQQRPQEPPEGAQTTLNERIVTILENGKPIVISQAADPAADRRMTVEAKATIVR